MDYIEIMDRLTEAYCDILQDNFVGMYVHGSIALGCFNPVSSDIDYVCVVHTEPDDEAKRRILEATLEMDAYAPKKGLEMHILRLCDCRNPVHPAYFCLHYSRGHTQSVLSDMAGYLRNMKGQDPDLGGHLTVLHECGVCWKGLPVQDVFAPVPKEMYLESILDDVIPGCGDEVYRICNLCRVWGYLAEGKVFSKRTGPEWALGQADGPAQAIKEALSCYERGCGWTGQSDAGAACALLQQKIIALLPERFRETYKEK